MRRCRSQGFGWVLRPLGGFYFSSSCRCRRTGPCAATEVPFPREGSPPRTRGAFQAHTWRSKTAFSFSPAIEGKKGALRPIHIHTGKHLGWGKPWSCRVTLASFLASSLQNGASTPCVWAPLCGLKGETETLTPGLALAGSFQTWKEGREAASIRPRDAAEGPKVCGGTGPPP